MKVLSKNLKFYHDQPGHTVCGKLNLEFCPEFATLLKESIGTMKISPYIIRLNKTLYLALLDA